MGFFSRLFEGSRGKADRLKEEIENLKEEIEVLRTQIKTNAVIGKSPSSKKDLEDRNKEKTARIQEIQDEIKAKKGEMATFGEITSLKD